MKKKELKQKVKELRGRNQGQMRNYRCLSNDFHSLLKENTALRTDRENVEKYIEHLKKQYNDLDLKANNIDYRYEILEENYDEKTEKYKKLINTLLNIAERFALDIHSFPEFTDQ